MPVLTTAEKDRFWREGWLFLADAVESPCLAELRHGFETWVEESRLHAGPYGETLDGTRSWAAAVRLRVWPAPCRFRARTVIWPL